MTKNLSKAGELYGRPWSEPEYLLALDLYLNYPDSRSGSSEQIQMLASRMGRTPAAVYMRMENFASLDPERSHSRRGLGNISPLCRRIFDDWYEKRDHLRSVAEVLSREADRAWSSRTLFDPDPVAVPKAFGKYELLDNIGQGTFGSVFSCVNIESGRFGAIKIIHADRIHDRESLHRFLREIRALKSVSHPHIIEMHEDNLETERSFPAFVMDLADINLTDYANGMFARRGIRPILEVGDAISVLRSMLAAVQALHSRSPKIAHRDLNPNNILKLSDGRWVLADFGLAKFVGATGVMTGFATKTQPGWGTTYYAAPEQYRDFKRTDEKADIYSLGVLLWELFTSVWPPFERNNLGLESDLRDICIRATERTPTSRFVSVDEFRRAFESTETVRRAGDAAP
jgi:serine/threonine protein kinase